MAIKPAPKSKTKQFTVRMPLADWQKVRGLFDPRFFTDCKATIYALNHYASTNTKKLP